MNIQHGKIDKILITNVPHLDPISVFLEDCGAGRGQVTIECFGKAWSYFWGGIGGKSIGEFFYSCDNHYLRGKFAPELKSTIRDEDGLPNHAKKHILSRRREDSISKETARKLYDLAENLCRDNENAMYDIYGDEWWDYEPTVVNPEWEYLGRILDAVKDGVNQYHIEN